MYAVVQTGGKQYRVKAGDELLIERRGLPPKSGTLKLDRVMLLAKGARFEVGRPLVKGAWCEAEFLKETKGRKVISFKYIRREKAATKIGHRQEYFKVRIKTIHGA
jgi:large subunit ribosomal protein L21